MLNKMRFPARKGNSFLCINRLPDCETQVIAITKLRSAIDKVLFTCRMHDFNMALHNGQHIDKVNRITQQQNIRQTASNSRKPCCNARQLSTKTCNPRKKNITTTIGKYMHRYIHRTYTGILQPRYPVLHTTQSSILLYSVHTYKIRFIPLSPRSRDVRITIWLQYSIVYPQVGSNAGLPTDKHPCVSQPHSRVCKSARVRPRFKR